MAENSCKKPELSIIIPAYNEEENIEETVLRSEKAAGKYFRDFEIVVVDDASNDRTVEIVRELKNRVKNLRLIEHEENRGKAGALNTGFKTINGKYIFYTDADNQYNINKIKDLRKKITDADVVSGYRINKAISPFRKFASDTYNLIARIFLSVKARDIECAFKIFKADKLKEIDIESSGFMVETEILAKATRMGYKIIDYPVKHYPREVGETSVSPVKEAFRSIKGLLFLKWILDIR